MDLGGFSGFQGSEVFQPVASVGGLWRPLAAFGDIQLPLKEGLWSFGGLDPGCLEAWRPGGLEAWRLVALAEVGGLEARGFEAGQVF